MTDKAEFRAVVVPRSMKVGVRYDVSVRMKNVGKTTWTRSDGYKLAVVASYTRRWITKEVKLGGRDRIKPNRAKVFRFKVTAPRRAGEYDFQWQMKRKRFWFPSPTDNVTITVN